MQYTAQLLAANETEGIRDFYAVHDDLESLYEQIVLCLVVEDRCSWTVSKVQYRCNRQVDGQCKMDCNEIRFKGLVHNADPFEMSLTIFGSRSFPKMYGKHKKRVYLVRFNRLDGDCMTFRSMRRCIERNTQSIFESECVSDELSLQMNLETFDIVDNGETEEKYDYSVYEEMENGDGGMGMVWL